MYQAQQLRVRSSCGLAVAESLERRRLFAGLGSTPGVSLPSNEPVPTRPDTPAGAKFSLVVPAYDSNPSATVRLELDFDGDSVPTWGSYTPGTTAAFDRDGDASTFSGEELAIIQEVWQRIAEKYSPFNINVTTNVSGDLSDGKVFKLDIGGSYNDWYGAPAGGVAYVGGFTTSRPNIGFVFAGEGVFSPKAIAEAAAHEAGHGFGLDHQSFWQNGEKVEEYSTNNGSSDYAPVMGVSYGSARGLWWRGTDAYDTFQSDVDELAGPDNAFGYRADEAGTFASPQQLTFTNDVLTAAGVITATPNASSSTSDADYYGFTLAKPSVVALKVGGAAAGAMLNNEVTLYDNNGAMIGHSNTYSDTAAEWLTYALPAGTYRVQINGVDERAQHNGDNIGQYTLSGFAFAPGPFSVAAGSSMTLTLGPAATAAVNAGITVEWDFDYDGMTFNVDSFGTTPTFAAPATAGGTTRTVGLRIGDPLGHTAVILVQVAITGTTVSTGQVTGSVFNDANGNAYYDSSEKGIAGVTVYVDADNDNVKDPGEQTTATDANGVYAFTLPAGAYKIRQIVPSGFNQTTPANGYGHQVTIKSGQTVWTRHFGDKAVAAPVNTGSISGIVYRDNNANAWKNADDTGISGVFVYLDTDNDGQYDAGEASTTTNSGGEYAFGNLAAGSYKVRQIVPDGYSQVSPAQNYGILVTLSTNQVVTGRNFFNKPVAAATTGIIKGFTFNDTNGDGTRNGTEGLAGGKTVWLDLDDDNVKDSNEPSTVTASDGSFTFSGLVVRTYHVRRQFPAGYAESTPPRYITLSAGQTVTGVTIGSKTK